ncbi:MAG TPA: glycosyltransferase family 2 protein [Solirubrobacterales bacterium]
MSDAPTVGVVITTYNRGLEYLPALLRSLEEQTYDDHAITIVADGGDAAVLGYLEREWPAVALVSTPQPRGYAGAAALGVRSSRGRYIAMLNDDVELEPRWLELLVDELEADPWLGFVTGKTLLYHDRELINETKQDLYTCGRFVPCGLLERDEGQWDQRLPAAIVSASTAVYRREAVEAAGGFDEDYLMYCEDADLSLRMVLLGYRGLYVPEAGAYHAWAASTGRGSRDARFYSVRNTLTTLLKDMPLSVLLTSLPKILLYQSHNLAVASGAGDRGSVIRAWASFLLRVPSTLRKRREIMQVRAIRSRDFKAMLLTAYPVPTGLAPRQLSEWFRHRVGRLLRFGGDLLEYVPEPIRPRIRGRDRQT